MKDYSAMSDQQINTAVGLSFGEKVGEVVNGLQLVNIDAQYLCSSFDPCNNPADAWPIITANHIGIMPFKSGIATAWPTSVGLLSDAQVKHENPLRAAMIVYLQMMEQKS